VRVRVYDESGTAPANPRQRLPAGALLGVRPRNTSEAYGSLCPSVGRAP